MEKTLVVCFVIASCCLYGMYNNSKNIQCGSDSIERLKKLDKNSPDFNKKLEEDKNLYIKCLRGY